jgi:hypothetical protein
MQKAADYFNVMYTTIARHLDTELTTKQGGQLVYFFSKEISEEMKDKRGASWLVPRRSLRKAIKP